MARSAARCSNRLMRRAVLAEPDRIVCHHVNDLLAHQRGQTNRWSAVIGEYQERAGVWDDAAVQRHSVHRRGHAVFAHAVMDEGPGIVRRFENLHPFSAGVVRASEIGRAAEHFRQRRGQHIEGEFGCGASRDLLRLLRELLL